MSNKSEATFHGLTDTEREADKNAAAFRAEPEPETIGDWAGHTPTKKKSSEELGDETSLKFGLQQRAASTITQRLLGVGPYILIQPEEEGGEMIVNVEAGGGATLADAGDFLETIGEALNDPELLKQVAEREAAAAAVDEELTRDEYDEPE